MGNGQLIKELTFLVDKFLQEKGLSEMHIALMVVWKGAGEREYGQAFATSMPPELCVESLMQQVNRIKGGIPASETLIITGNSNTSKH